MGSVSSPALRSCEPRLAAPRIGPRWKIASLLSLLVVLIVVLRPAFEAEAISAWVVFVSCYFWKQHLDSAGVLGAWSLLVSLLLFWELMAAVLRGPTSAGMLPTAVGCYLLSYLMIWTLAAQDSDVHLQALATAALLLSAIIFARAAVLISAFFLSVVLLLRCRRNYGGVLKSALLIFTPAVLCMLTLVLLHNLGVDVVREPFSELRIRSFQLPTLANLSSPRENVLPSVAFAFSVLYSRISQKAAKTADLAYAGLLLCQVLGVTLHAAGDISGDIIMSAYGGGMCLVAVTPPRKTVALALLLLALLAGAVPELTKLHTETLLPFHAVYQ